MEEIPGKENYIGDLEDDSLGMTSKVRTPGALQGPIHKQNQAK